MVREVKVNMYSSFPKTDRWRIRTTLTVGWLFAALGGFGGVVFTPDTVAHEIGDLAVGSSWVVMAFSLIAAVGTAFNHHWIEWIAAWFAAGGASAYAVGVWWIVFSGTPTRLQQAAYMTAFLSFMVYRGVTNSAHAKKLRVMHETIKEIKRGTEL